MALPNPATGDTVQATDVSGIKDHLEGGSGKTAPYHLKMSSGSFQITLADNAGATKFRVNDSDGVEVFSINSDGGATFATSPSFATLILPQAASPTPTTEGSIFWDTDDDVIRIGDGATTKVFGKLGSTVALASGTASAGTGLEASRVDHVHPGVMYKYKTATQTVSASTTFVTVTASSGNFDFAIAANEVWQVEWYLPLTFTSTGGFKAQITGPAAATAVHINAISTVQRLTDNTSPLAIPIVAPIAFITSFSSDIVSLAGSTSGTADGVWKTSAASNWIYIRAFIQNGANAGTVTLQFAQNNAAGTVVAGVGAYMRAEKMS